MEQIISKVRTLKEYLKAVDIPIGYGLAQEIEDLVVTMAIKEQKEKTPPQSPKSNEV